MRFVFVIRSRRGLGHVVRATCVAEALSDLRPDAEIVLAVSHEVPDELTGRVTSRVVLGQDLSADRLRGFDPDVVLFDTVVPAAWRSWCELPRPPRLALMMREMTSAALASLRQHPVFSLLDRILIPHPAGEFDPGIVHAVHVGAIARLQGAGGEPAVGGVPLLVSTAGGGGHRELCEPFIDMCLAADRELRARHHGFVHRLLTGPRFDGRLGDPGAVRVSSFEPELPALMAAARLVIARAGYNTVHELEMVGTPAILVPGNPGLDDQRQRAERAARAGRAVIVEPGDVQGLVRAVEPHLNGSPATRRPAVGGRRWTSGAEAAARELDALAEWLPHARRGADRSRSSGGSAPQPGLTAATDEELRATLSPILCPRGLPRGATFECRRSDMSALRTSGGLERIEATAGDRRARFWAKTYPDQQGRQLFWRLRQLAPGLPVVRPVAYLARHEIMLIEEAPGVRMDAYLGRHVRGHFTPFSEGRMEDLGATLAVLHREAPPMFPTMTVRCLLDGLDPAPASMPEPLRAAAVRVANALCVAGDPSESEARLCHRDLHPRQAFYDGEHVVFIDLDHACLAHPAIDLANLSVYLQSKHGELAAPLVAALGRGYERAGGKREPSAESIYAAFTRLRLAAKLARTRVDDWESRALALLDGCEDIPGPVERRETPATSAAAGESS